MDGVGMMRLSPKQYLASMFGTTWDRSAPAARRSSDAEPVNARIRILLVPGFVADTYSEIERSYVELSARSPRDIEFLWLVPEISSKYNYFARPEQRATMTEPAYAPHLRAYKVPYVVGTVSKYNPLANVRLFGALFRRHRIDAVYTHFGYERFWAVVCGKLFGKTTIWNEHWYSLGKRYGALKRVFYRVFVDEFIAVSRFIAATLPRGSRVHTVHNAIHGGVRRADAKAKREARRRLAIDADAKVVLMIAAFRPEKRHTIALEIVARVLDARRDVVFVFAGAGPLKPGFVDVVRARGWADRVVLPGHVDNVDDYYTAADVSMLTSLHEGFGYVVLESMKNSLPVVTFDNGAPAEIVKHGETGFLIPEGKTDEFARYILDLLDDERLRSALGESGRDAVQRDYDRDAWVLRLSSVLRSIVLERRRPAVASADKA